jgi:predicted AlkP superfamily pyrophosphatase or phosphodiesterase
MAGGPITTVAPSTTATALTSLTTGKAPARHGVVGYRVRVLEDEVLNVLRWSTAAGDARQRVPPESVQRLEPFLGTKPPVVTRGEFADSGFSRAHLAGSPHSGWRYPSTIAVRVRQLVNEGHDFVYAYYPGVDSVAHEFGFGDEYDAELAAADRIVGAVRDALPATAALVVVSDHGQVEVGDALVPIEADVARLTVLQSGEGRFRWLHAGPGLADRLLAVASERYGSVAWVRSRDQVVADGWFGGEPDAAGLHRLGDVALVAHEPVAFVDPADTGGSALRCRHGSLTPAEMFVPLLAGRGAKGGG